MHSGVMSLLWGAERRRVTVASAFYVVAFIAWVVITPGTDAFTRAGNNILGLAGPLVISLFILANAFQPDAGNRIGGRWSPALIGLGIFCYAIGDIIWSYYEIILGIPSPFPSWADAAYLAGCPIFLIGIIVAPVGKRSLVPRTRLILDSAIIVLVASSVSWFFLVGPSLEGGIDALWATVIGLGYPVSDLVLVVCLILIWSRMDDERLHHAFGLISSGLILIIAADSLFAYLEMGSGYETGYVMTDVAWVAGYMLLALGAIAMQARPCSSVATSRHPDSQSSSRQSSSLLRLLLPYALLPVAFALFAYAWMSPDQRLREQGLAIMCVGLVIIVILRQIVAIIENQHLQNETVAYAKRLEQLATTDPLTNLPNHRALMMTLDHEIERAERYERHFSVLFLDLDHFKTINDTLGHPKGDAVLSEVAQVIAGCVRTVDCVGRWGGEEFLAILPEADCDAAASTAERIRGAVASRIFAVGGGVHITCSIGSATFGTDAHDRDMLIALADEALYTAKRLGRNQVRAASGATFTEAVAAVATHDLRESVSMIGMVEALTSLVAARDQYTSHHSRDVGTLAMRVAVALGLTASEAQTLGQAGQLHDIGKVAIPDAILRKPGPLTPDEWTAMKRHPCVSAEVVSHVPALRHIAPIIRSHHERIDGTGYPDQLAGEEIPVGARILAVVDTFAAITTDRPYRAAESAAWALAELRRGAGTQFDPNIVTALERVLAADPSTTLSHHAPGYLRISDQMTGS